MKVREVLHKSEWKKQNEFLQSWEYGEFLHSVGRTIRRLEYTTKEGIGQIQCIENKTFFGISFIYIPRSEVTTSGINVLLKYFKNKYAFARFEIVNEIGDIIGFRQTAVTNRQPHHTWLLDITQSQDQLLAKMHPKTRYNIKISEKKGVTIAIEKNLNTFWELNTITTERNSYQSHEKKYIESLLSLPYTKQYTAYVQNKPIASAIVLFYEGTAIYFLGASSNEYRNFMAPYALHMYIINDAKKNGCTAYDWWGIAPPAVEGEDKTTCFNDYCWQNDHPLTGVSRFKAGFGGICKSYPSAFEVPLNYFLYSIVRLINKLRKRTIVGHPI